MLYGIDGSHVPQYVVGFSLKMYINPLMLTLPAVESVEITPLVIEANLFVMDMIKPWKGPKGAMPGQAISKSSSGLLNLEFDPMSFINFVFHDPAAQDANMWIRIAAFSL